VQAEESQRELLMRQRGFNLIELLITMAIAAIILAIAAPAFQEIITNGRTRSVSESIYSGMQLARSEAIKRNAPMRFQLVSSMDSTCAPSAASRLWLVTQYTDSGSRGVATGKCDSTPNLPADPGEPCPTGSPVTCSTDPFIAFKSPTDTVANTVVAATPTVGIAAGFVITFGPLGQLLDSLEGAKSATSPAYTVTVTPSGGLSGRTYTVQVGANGGLKYF
jgi:type IV fimbrial biogenesis protein FimT